MCYHHLVSWVWVPSLYDLPNVYQHLAWPRIVVARWDSKLDGQKDSGLMAPCLVGRTDQSQQPMMHCGERPARSHGSGGARKKEIWQVSFL